jgi:hypothetical protein
LDRAIKRSRGDILLVLNADDILLPQAVAWAVGAMRANSKAGVVYGDAYLINEAGDMFGEFQAPDYDFEAVLCVEKVIPAQAAFIRRTALEAVGFGADPTLDTCPDYEMFVRLGLKTPMVHVPGFVTKYRQYPRAMDGGSPRTIGRFLAAKLLVMERVFNNPDTPARIKQLRQRAQVGVRLWASQEARSIGRLGLAWEYYAQALQQSSGMGSLLGGLVLNLLAFYRRLQTGRRARQAGRISPSQRYFVWVGAGLGNETLRSLLPRGQAFATLKRWGSRVAKIGQLILAVIFAVVFFYLVYLVWLLAQR